MSRTQLSQRGFSILEVLITAAIIGTITGLIVLKYGAFNNLILLKNQAYQIALDLRDIQARALSALGDGTNFRDGYGVYFATAQNDRYIFFVDLNDNNIYNTGEEIETRRIDSRFRLSRLCNGTSCGITTMSVVFRRPNFDAKMNNGSVSLGRIEIVGRTGSSTRTVQVNAAGQISVE